MPPYSRMLNPVKCKLCGLHWDRKNEPLPPCNDGHLHTQQEWDDFFATNDVGLPEGEQRIKWLPDDPPGKEVRIEFPSDVPDAPVEKSQTP